MSNAPPTLDQIAAWYAANPQSAAGPAPAPAAPAPPPPAFGPPPGWPLQPAPQPPAQAQQSFPQLGAVAPPGLPPSAFQAPVGNVPAAATAALVAIQTSQPAPINPPESVAALQPDAAPPPEKRKRGSRQAAAKSGPAAAAAPASAETDADPRDPRSGYSLEEQLAFATTEELTSELARRGYSGALNFGQGG